MQGAIDASRDGDIVEVQAGYTFVENVRVGAKRNITIRSARWRELPAAGYRIDPDRHASLLATIQTNTTQPAFDIGTWEHSIIQNGVNVAADTITFEWADVYSRFADGIAVTCSDIPPAVLPKPLVARQRYWIRDWQPVAGGRFQGRLAKTKGGAAIDLTTIGSSGAGGYYERPRCTQFDQPTGIRVQGIRFAVGGTTAPRQLVVAGHNLETDPVRMGPNAEFRQVVITGRQNDTTGPLFCLALFGGRDHVVQDSWIGHCKAQGDESKGISIQNTVGALIRNNYISAASINVLTAGGDAASMDVNRKIAVLGNFLEKPGYMLYKEGAGEPTGECYYGGGSGAFYRRTDVTPNSCTNGACYTCTPAKQWQLDANASYRATHYVNKNLLEFKDCEDCRVEGNMMRGSYGGSDGGQGWCYGLAVIVSGPGTYGGGSPYHRAHNVSFKNNWADYCYSGLSLTHSSYDGVIHAQMPIKNVLVEDNLFSNMGAFPAMSQWADSSAVMRFAVKQTLGSQDTRLINNTFRAKSDYKMGLLLYSGAYPNRTMGGYKFNNNLVSYSDYPFFLEGATFSCSSDGLFRFFPNDGTTKFRSNVFFGGDPTSNVAYLNSSSCRPLVENAAFESSDAQAGFVSASNHRLAPSSPYSASNPAARFLSAGTGDDVGADVDLVEQYALAAERGRPSTSGQLGLKVVAASDSAEISFRRPSESRCLVTIYDRKSRVPANENADTNTPARRQDDRMSSIVSGSSVHFYAGSVTPLAPNRPYWYRVDCGPVSAVGQFETKGRGSSSEAGVRGAEPVLEDVQIPEL